MHTFVDPLRHAVRTAAHTVAVIDGDRSVTFAELWDRCGRMSGLMNELEVAPGGRVAILADNSLPYYDAYLGVPMAGRAIVPLNTRHAEPELAYALDDGGVSVLFIDRDPGGLADHVDVVVRIDESWDDRLKAAPLGPLGEGVTENDLAGLFYTGGTTGASKGVMLTHRNLIANATNTIIGCGLTSDDSWLIQAPMFHAAGSFPVLAMIWLGATALTVPFNADTVLDQIEKHRVTATLGVPTMVAALTETQSRSPRDVSSLRLLSHGGSPIATEVVRRAHESFPDAELIHLYGATETAPLATFLRHEETQFDSPRIRSVGTGIVGVEIRVAAPGSFDSLPDGEVGEVLIRGNNVMAGYWNKPEQTDAVLVDGWYRSGDLGYIDSDGHLFLVDRAKDMIVTGGENVYSTEVEEVLFKHEAVREATVFGIPDDQWGEAVHAVVVPWDTEAGVDTDELIDFCRARIANYKVPKSIQVRLEPLPVSGPGKVLKRELRAPFWEGRDSQI